MSSDTDVEVSALAINVTIPEALRWTDARRRETFILTTLNVRLLPDGHLAARLTAVRSWEVAVTTHTSSCLTGPSLQP
jgi:hypothetical protein